MCVREFSGVYVRFLVMSVYMVWVWVTIDMFFYEGIVYGVSILWKKKKWTLCYCEEENFKIIIRSSPPYCSGQMYIECDGVW